MSSAKNTPKELLVSFFHRMKQWEVNAFNRKMDYIKGTADRSEMLALIKSDLQDIMQDCCTSKHQKYEKHSAGDPTEYDPDEERILEVREEGDKVSIYTECTNRDRFQGKWMYVLVKDGDQWKLDERREFQNGKYKKVDL